MPMKSNTEQARPVITLLTDFGEEDGYVAAMKGVIFSECPEANVVDASHCVPPQDIRHAAWVLAQYWRLYPEGAIHVGVVDPGVGTCRRALVIEADKRYLVLPDNGLAALVVAAAKTCRFHAIHDNWHRPGPLSATFHGRDVFAYAAAVIASGAAPPDTFSAPVETIVTPDWAVCRSEEDGLHGAVIHIDHFGNLITNIRATDLGGYAPDRLHIQCGALHISGLSTTYSDVAEGAPVALISSTGTLEIALRNASAAQAVTSDTVHVFQP